MAVDAQPPSPDSPDPNAVNPPAPSEPVTESGGELFETPPATTTPPLVTVTPVPPVTVMPGMSRGKKIAIGVGNGVGVVAIGTILYFVLRKKDEEPQPPGGLGGFGDFTVMDTVAPMGECPCKAKARAAAARKRRAAKRK